MRQICKVLKENYVHRYDTTIKKEVSLFGKAPMTRFSCFHIQKPRTVPHIFRIGGSFSMFFSILPSSASNSNGVSCDQCTVPWIGANFSPT